jgi:yopX protein
MLQPKVYIKELNIVREVEMVDFYNKQVLVHDVGVGFRGGAAIFSFDKVEFIENTGFKDNNGKYIYVGDIVTLDDEYGDDYKVMQDEDELTFYLEPIPPFCITDKEIQLRKSMEYKITIIER